MPAMPAMAMPAAQLVGVLGLLFGAAHATAAVAKPKGADADTCSVSLKALGSKVTAPFDFVCDTTVGFLHYAKGSDVWVPATPPAGTVHPCHRYKFIKGPPPTGAGAGSQVDGGCRVGQRCPACLEPQGQERFVGNVVHTLHLLAGTCQQVSNCCPLYAHYCPTPVPLNHTAKCTGYNGKESHCTAVGCAYCCDLRKGDLLHRCFVSSLEAGKAGCPNTVEGDVNCQAKNLMKGFGTLAGGALAALLILPLFIMCLCGVVIYHCCCGDREASPAPKGYSAVAPTDPDAASGYGSIRK